ncbi:CNKR1 kinase, partial [Brachypteracias leptosomus]|nr:CNKR1 kinase [Brachypteracias leptosomus]
MEPVGAWGPARAAAWLREQGLWAGLDAVVQGYPFEEWGLAGPDLLGLSGEALEALGGWRLGHQELLLEAVEQLRALDAGLASTSLRTLTEKLRELAQSTQGLVLGGSPAGAAHQPPSLTLLAHVIDLLSATKRLFSWLNRYLFSTLNDFSASRDIVLLCAQLAETLQMDCPTAERNGRILQICQHIVGICESIVGCSPPALLDRRAVLQPTPHISCTSFMPPSQHPQGLEITSTNSCLHFVSATTPEVLAAQGGRVLPGDEIVQVNEQVVVGWTHTNLVKKLLEKSSGVTLVLKKIPLDPPSSPSSPRQQVSDPSTPSTAPGLHQPPPPRCLQPHSSSGREICGCQSLIVGPPLWSRGFLTQGIHFPPSAAADLESGPDSAPDLVTDEEDGEDERDTRLPREDLLGLPGSGRGEQGGVSKDGAVSPPRTGGWSPTRCLQVLQRRRRQRLGGMGLGALLGSPPPAPDPPQTLWPPGVATRLSRRRVSCRDLGRVDCDGWLLKKKDHVGFMAQKWKRCWFVLKGHTLYWYHHPNDEKAAGLINVATYDLESTREQKKKYVFQLSHQRYKPFIFAAETLADLSMWVSHLIAAKTKYALAPQSVPDKEEDCYSETEAEDPDEESPRHGCDSVSGSKGRAGEGTEGPHLTSCLIFSPSPRRGCSPQTEPSPSRPAASPAVPPAAPRAAPGPAHPWVGAGEVTLVTLSPCHPLINSRDTLFVCVLGANSSWDVSDSPSSPPDPSGEDLESLVQCLRQGGVSLTGRQRFLTQEQCRKSFIRRNKNPHINEKVHAVRALQSTLKAKQVELKALEQLLSDPALTSDKFRRWKEEHQELYQELREWWARRQDQDPNGGLGAERDPHEEAAEP